MAGVRPRSRKGSFSCREGFWNARPGRPTPSCDIVTSSDVVLSGFHGDWCFLIEFPVSRPGFLNSGTTGSWGRIILCQEGRCTLHPRNVSKQCQMSPGWQNPHPPHLHLPLLRVTHLDHQAHPGAVSVHECASQAKGISPWSFYPGLSIERNKKDELF